MSFESDTSIAFLIAKTRNILKNELEKELKPHGLTYAQRVILIRLCEKDGLTQKELAQDTYFEQSNMTLMLDKLELKGLIKRIPKENDRRAYLVKITPQGRELRGLLIKMGDHVIERAFRGVSEQQKEELSHLLKTLYENLQNS
ncbi:MarR family winged helix-turn-helix transcriptional regulator [Sulfuricurvum sp.]|uniref:MarR family winged helix-turn-helix transcriptional regulator n=1 Tax=Sulfuricurvum sp. TaxID=2025608 RepID=UPI003C590E89